MDPEFNTQSFSTPAERAGLALIATAGLASAISTAGLIVYIVWNAFLGAHQSRPLSRGVRSFLLSPLGCYLLSLLCCDFCQGVAFALNYYWAGVGSMSHGKVCTIQGVVSELGDLGAAIWSMAIAFHTFWLLFLVRKPHRLAAPAVMLAGWSLLIILPIIGPFAIQTPTRGSFYGLSGAWCWIGPSYGTARLLYLYAWIFAALASSVVIYTLIYLRFASIITLQDNGRMKIHFRSPKPETTPTISTSQTGVRHSRATSSTVTGCFKWASNTRDSGAMGSDTIISADRQSDDGVGDYLKRIAGRLMWYPIAYTLVVLPVSVCRMGVLSGWQPPFGLLVFAGICFGGSGVTNSVLFITTRHSFIKQVTKTKATHVRVTTQRITIREDWTGGREDVELGEVNEEGEFSPVVSKSVEFYPGIHSPTYGVNKNKVTMVDHVNLGRAVVEKVDNELASEKR